MAEGTETKTKVFLSYSRVDSGFCVRLAETLDRSGYAAIYDRSEAPAGEDPDTRLTAQDEWWSQLKTMIAASDVMVFVVSPASASSRVCDEEIAHARNLGKRIIAILRTDIDFNSAPERLRALNVKIDFRNDETFESAASQLRQELDLDIEWHRRGSHYMRLAQRWDADGRPEGQLLRAGAISEADTWASRRPREATPPGPLLLAFLDHSREKERVDSEGRRRTLGRTFVKPARQAFDEGNHDAALRLTAAGILLSEDLDMSLVPERATEGQWLRAAFENRLLGVLHTHADKVTAAAFSPDGRLLVTASADQTTRLWDVASASELAVLRHDREVARCSFSPDGRFVLTASNDGTARIWDVKSATELHRLKGQESSIQTAIFSPNGRFVLTASWDGTVRLWAVDTGAQVRSFPGEHAAAFSPDGEYIATGAPESAIRLFRATDGKAVKTLKGEGALETVVFSPDGKLIAAARSDEAYVWSVSSGEQVARLSAGRGAINGLAFSPDGAHIATGANDRTARLWDIRTGTEIFRCEHRGWVQAVLFSPDGSRLATFAKTEHDPLNAENAVYIWDSATGKALLALRGHHHWLESIAFSPDGRRLVSTAADNTARIWDLALGPEIVRFWQPYASSIAQAELSPDGRRLVTAGGGGEAHLWDVETGADLDTVGYVGVGAKVERSQFSPDGKMIATTCPGHSVQIWSQDAKEVVARLSRDTPELRDARFASDGKIVVVADVGIRFYDARSYKQVSALDIKSEKSVISRDCRRLAIAAEQKSPADKPVSILDLQTGRRTTLELQESPECIEFSEDGSLLVTGAYDGARVWDASTGALVCDALATDMYASLVAIDPGKRLVAVASDKTTAVWDIQSGTEVSVMTGHMDEVRSVGFSPDSSRVMTGSPDGTARIWDVETGNELARLGHDGGVVSAQFVGVGKVLTTSDDGSARLWDVSRTEGLVGSPLHALAASLTYGRGIRSKNEARDLIMQNAPESLLDALSSGFSDAERTEMHRRAQVLARAANPRCYVPRRDVTSKGTKENVASEQSVVSTLDDTQIIDAPRRARARRKLNFTTGVVIAFVGLIVGAGAVLSLNAWLK